MPTPIDKLDRVITHNLVAVPSAVAPTGDEVVNITYNKQNVLVINAKLSTLGATATVRLWVYDDTPGIGSWIPVEDVPLPRSTFTNDYATPIFLNTKFQTAGITVTALSAGTITISACFVSSDTI